MFSSTIYIPPKSAESATRRAHFEDAPAGTASTSNAPSKSMRNTNTKNSSKQTKPKLTSKQTYKRKTPAKRAQAPQPIQQKEQSVEVASEPRQEPGNSEFPGINDILAVDVADTTLHDDVQELPPCGRTPQQTDLDAI